MIVSSIDDVGRELRIEDSLLTDVVNVITNDTARIVDLSIDPSVTPRRFMVTYVHNTGPYAKGWWWYYDIDETTLDDLGTLYEKVVNGTLLTPTNRSTLYSLMAGKAEYQLESYDWTGLWSTDIPKIINQEAPVGMPGVLTQTFMNQMNLTYKAGNYKICGATCATYVDHISIAGWAQIPFCSGGTTTSKQYVFGIFIYNSTSDSTSSATFNATKSELLREQIHAGLASCYHQVYLPQVLK